jgi:hypothetical protein
MDAFRFPSAAAAAAAAASARTREHALSRSSAAAVVPLVLSPRALFEAIRQRESADPYAPPAPDRGEERDSAIAATEMFGYAYDHAFAMEEKLRQCRQAHAVGVYVPLAEHDLYAAFARYIGCVEAGARTGSSALAAFHRAMPVEQRDDEWRAVDAVLHRHHHHR